MKNNLNNLMAAVETAKNTLNDLMSTRKPGQHGARRQIRRAEETLSQAKAAYAEAYAEAKRAASVRFVAEQRARTILRREEIKEVFREARKTENSARQAREEAARETREAKKQAARKAKAELKRKESSARRFEREERQIRRRRLEEAADLFRGLLAWEEKKEMAEAAGKAKAAEVKATNPSDREANIRAIYARIQNCRLLADTAKERIDALRDRRSDLNKAWAADKRALVEVERVEADFFGPDCAMREYARKAANLDRRYTQAMTKVEAELRAVRAAKDDAKAEAMALKEALVYIAADNKVDAAFVAILADVCREYVKKEPSAEVRLAAKIPQKERVQNFAVRTFSADVLYAELKQLRNETVWNPDYVEGTRTLTKESAQLLKLARDARRELQAKAKELLGKPFTVRHQQGTVIHLPKTMLSVCDGIECDTIGVRGEYIVADHGTEDFFSTNPLVWVDPEDVTNPEANLSDIGAGVLAYFCEGLYNRLEQNGLVVDGKTKYICDHAGASQLKAEKVVMAADFVRKAGELVRYFGKTEDEFVRTGKCAGPDLEKAWANLNRPWACDLVYADGTVGKPSDILVVKNPEYVYYHGRAITLGDSYSGKPYREGPVENPVGLFLGQIGFWKPLKGQGGQLNGYGLKGFAYYCGGSILEEVCRRNSITREQFFDCKVKNIDGEMVRVGDYTGIATDDIWKFDKFFGSYREYLQVIDRLAKRWPIVARLGVLRQSEDEEDAYKKRRMSRSILQQIFSWTMKEADELVAPSVKRVRAQMRFDGAIRRLAGLTKDEAERTPLEILFGNAPFLFANPGVQKAWKAKVEAMIKELQGCYLDAKGQYPYIVQDPVAMLEILCLNKEPKETGVLPKGCISLADVPADTEVMAVRFPANFLTAKVMVNMPLSKIFRDLGNLCVLSIHDDILVVQDGDTDGDEICIIYSPLLAELIKRMMREIQPPVVVFEHGKKMPATDIGSLEELRRRLAHARFSASHNDQTGIYADMARDLLMLATEAWVNGNKKEFEELLRMATAASTGAIISIDQVKGTLVSAVLNSWLKAIGTHRNKRMQYKKPYTQQFLKKDVGPADCLPPQEYSLPDTISVKVTEQIGPYKAEMPFVWNAEAALAAFTLPIQHKQVNKHPLSKAVLEFLGNTLYNNEVLVGADGVERVLDADFKAAVKAGAPVGMKDLLVYLWHNERALSQKAEGRLLAEKRQEYYRLCWSTIVDFAMTDMTGDQTVKTPAVKKYSAYFTCLNQALELTRGNGETDEGGTYTWFLLNVIAPAMTAVVRKNGWKLEDFQSAGAEVTAEETAEEVDLKAELEKALSEQADMFGDSSRAYMDPIGFFDEPDEDVSVLDDGTIEMSSDEEPPISAEDWTAYATEELTW